MLNTKKVFLFLGLLLVSMIFLSNGVLAYWNFGYSIDNAARSVQPIAQFFLGGFDYTGQLLFERFLVFLIIFAVTFVAIVKAPFFKDQRPAAIIISIIVPLLSVRYIDFEWMNTIIKKSTLISGISEKQRYQVFKKYFKYIDDLEEKIK